MTYGNRRLSDVPAHLDRVGRDRPHVRAHLVRVHDSDRPAHPLRGPGRIPPRLQVLTHHLGRAVPGHDHIARAVAGTAVTRTLDDLQPGRPWQHTLVTGLGLHRVE